MSDPIIIVNEALLGSPAVVGLVVDRIFPLMHSNPVYPVVIVERVGITPLNCFDGWTGTDSVSMRVESWALTYEQASILSNACRAALQTAQFFPTGGDDVFDPSGKLAGAYCVAIEFSFWA